MDKEKLKKYGILVKVIEDEYVTPALDGELHFTPLCYFKKLEQTSGDVSTGDKNEGRVVFEQNYKKVYFKYNNCKKNLGPVKIKASLGITDEGLKNIGVACFMFFDYSQLEMLDEYEEKQAFCFTSEIIKDITDFIEDKPKNKDYKVLIYNANSFRDAIFQSEYDLEYSLVHYYDRHSMNDFFNELDNKEDIPEYFKKSSAYKTQHEYRVVKKLNSLNGENINISSKDKFVEVVTPEELKNLSIVVSFD